MNRGNNRIIMGYVPNIILYCRFWLNKLTNVSNIIVFLGHDSKMVFFVRFLMMIMMNDVEQ